MREQEAVLVAEVLASDVIEELHIRFLEAAMKLGANSLQVLILCHLMVGGNRAQNSPLGSRCHQKTGGFHR
jgi:hypothetical protein